MKDVFQVSVSKLTEWYNCQLKYALRYIDKEKRDAESDPIYAGIGHVIHYCFAMAVRHRLHPTKFVEESIAKYNDELGSLTSQQFKRIWNALKTWNVIEPLTFGDEAYPELSFWLNADTTNRVMLHGVIDLCVKRGDYFNIIDYKCKLPHRQAKDFEIRRDDQLCLYAIAVAVLFQAPLANIRTSMFFPDNQRLVTVEWSTERAQAWLNHSINTAHEMLDTPREKMAPLPDKQRCGWCDYKSKCTLKSVL